MFKYYSNNINHLLPSSWVNDIIAFSKLSEKEVILTSNSITSREKTENEKIPTLIVDGLSIKEKLPWLYDLYRGLFFDIAKKKSGLELKIAQNPLYAINFNIQRGNEMRNECHVDSNPLQGLLYITTHKRGDGGELVVSNINDTYGIEKIRNNCTIIYPNSGDLIFFDARVHPHYVESLKSENSFRIAISMNFYTENSPEKNRPQDLNQHLFKK